MAIEGEIRICRMPDADGTGTTQVKIEYDPSNPKSCVRSLGATRPSFAAVLSKVPRDVCAALLEANLCPRGLSLTLTERLQEKF